MQKKTGWEQQKPTVLHMCTDIICYGLKNRKELLNLYGIIIEYTVCYEIHHIDYVYKVVYMYIDVLSMLPFYKKERK